MPPATSGTARKCTSYSLFVASCGQLLDFHIFSFFHLLIFHISILLGNPSDWRHGQPRDLLFLIHLIHVSGSFFSLFHFSIPFTFGEHLRLVPRPAEGTLIPYSFYSFKLILIFSFSSFSFLSFFKKPLRLAPRPAAGPLIPYFFIF